MVGKRFRCGKSCGQTGEKFPIAVRNPRDRGRQQACDSDANHNTAWVVCPFLCQFDSLVPVTFTNADADASLKKATLPLG